MRALIKAGGFCLYNNFVSVFNYCLDFGTKGSISMSKEKIYFEEGDVSVTSSRVLYGAKNHFLRNINSAQVTHEPSNKGALYLTSVFFLVLGIAVWLYTYGAGTRFFAVSCLLISGIPLIGALTSKEKYFAYIVGSGLGSGGHSYFLESETDELPTKVVDAINSALLDLHKLGESEKSDEKSDNKPDSSDEIMKLKGLLDAGAITQEEFDAKKKELLGL